MLRIDFKTAIILVLSIVVAVLSTCNSCQKIKYEKKLANCEQSKKEIIHDTTTILIPQQAALAETFSKVKETKPTPREIDSFIQYEVIVDTTDLAKLKAAYYDLVKEHNKRNEYSDTAIFKNGIAIVNSTVKRNELIDQHTILDSLRQEVITNTIIQTKYKDRTQLYLGIEALGSKYEFINAAGFTALLKLKGNIGLEGGYFFNSQNQNFYKAGFKFLIRFKKP